MAFPEEEDTDTLELTLVPMTTAGLPGLRIFGFSVVVVVVVVGFLRGIRIGVRNELLKASVGLKRYTKVQKGTKKVQKRTKKVQKLLKCRMSKWEIFKTFCSLGASRLDRSVAEKMPIHSIYLRIEGEKVRVGVCTEGFFLLAAELTFRCVFRVDFSSCRT